MPYQLRSGVKVVNAVITMAHVSIDEDQSYGKSAR
jgi:hypothetical protein